MEPARTELAIFWFVKQEVAWPMCLFSLQMGGKAHSRERPVPRGRLASAKVGAATVLFSSYLAATREMFIARKKGQSRRVDYKTFAGHPVGLID